MRIVDRKTFLGMPAGTVFAKVETPPTYDFGPVAIKGDTCAGVDFFVQDLVGGIVGAEDTGEWIAAIDEMHAGGWRTVDLDIQARDGLFDDDQLFAVFEHADHEALIARLQQAFRDAF